MTENKGAATGLRHRDQTTPDDSTDGPKVAHTELRALNKGPRPRAKILPPELSDDDDMFNDMPV